MHQQWRLAQSVRPLQTRPGPGQFRPTLANFHELRVAQEEQLQRLIRLMVPGTEWMPGGENRVQCYLPAAAVNKRSGSQPMYSLMGSRGCRFSLNYPDATLYDLKILMALKQFLLTHKSRSLNYQCAVLAKGHLENYQFDSKMMRGTTPHIRIKPIFKSRECRSGLVGRWPGQ
jgi:hypothetical protein